MAEWCRAGFEPRVQHPLRVFVPLADRALVTVHRSAPCAVCFMSGTWGHVDLLMSQRRQITP